jgi:hypothetical protein
MSMCLRRLMGPHRAVDEITHDLSGLGLNIEAGEWLLYVKLPNRGASVVDSLVVLQWQRARRSSTWS